MAVIFKKKGEATVTVEKNNEVIEEQKIPLDEVVSFDPLAVVDIGLGCTVNMGNYNSLRMNVGVRMPSKAGAEALEQTFETYSQWVEKKLDVLHGRMTGESEEEEPEVPKGTIEDVPF